MTKNRYTAAIMTALALLLTAFPLFAQEDSSQEDSFMIFGKDYGKLSPKFVKWLRINTIDATDFKDIDGINNPEEFIRLMEIWSSFFPEKSNLYIKYPDGWFSKLTQDQKERLNKLNAHYYRASPSVDFMALSNNELISKHLDKAWSNGYTDKQDKQENFGVKKWCNSNHFKYHRWIGERYSNFGVEYNGNVSYQYYDNPDKSSDETRIYDGTFKYWKSSPYREIHRLEGNFKLDKQVGKWTADYLGYYIEFNFNEDGEIDGHFALYENKFTRDEKKVYSGFISKSYVTYLEYNGDWNANSSFNTLSSRKINAKGIYGVGNGHPADTWIISLTNAPDYRIEDEFFRIPQGDYTVSYVHYADGYKLENDWGETGNWGMNENTVCTYIEEATGKRKNAGKMITEIPRRLSDNVVNILNRLLLRKSKGLKYSYMKR